jgi:DNA-binding CsgD family transcriptional regulator
MFEGLNGLVGGAASSGGEGRWAHPRPVEAVTTFDTFEPSVRKHFVSYMQADGPSADPVFHALERHHAVLVTRTRRQLVTDAEWYRCRSFVDFRRPMQIDHQLTSMWQVAPGRISMICIHRALGDRDFSARERRLLHFFHQELGQLIGTSLVSATEPLLQELPRRLRQTLTCLMQGDSEKQVAERLGLSRATTHQYVTALYRRFGVQSRPQLMAYAFRRMGREKWSPPIGEHSAHAVDDSPL